MNELAVAYDRCPECGETKPCEEFPLRHGSCSSCLVADRVKDARREERTSTAAVLAAKQLLAGVKRRKIDVPHTSELAEALDIRWGGVKAFADSLYEDLQFTIKNSPGTRLSMDAHKVYIDLIKVSTEHRETAPDVGNVTDAELEDEVITILHQAITKGHINLNKLTEGTDGSVDDTPQPTP